MLQGLRQLDVKEQDEAVVKNRLSQFLYCFLKRIIFVIDKDVILHLLLFWFRT